MNIEEYVKNNKTYNILNKGAIQKAQSLVGSNEEILYALVTNVSIGNLDSVNGIEVSVNGYNYYIKADGSCVQKDDIGANSQYNTGLNGQYSQETNENNY